MIKLNNKQYNAEIAGKILEFHKLKESHKRSEDEFKKQIEKLTIDIKNFMFAHGVDNLKFSLSERSESGNSQVMVCKKVTPVSVTFLADKLEEKLDKQLVESIVHKEVVIEDWNGFIEYMKELGANSKEVKKFISVNKVVDKKALENAEKLGQVSLKELKGCYTTKQSAAYLRTEISEEDE